MIARVLLGISTAAAVIGLAMIAYGFDWTGLEYWAIWIGPYKHRGTVQLEVPQMIGPFGTKTECRRRLTQETTKPGARIVRDCFIGGLPAAADFPPPWKPTP